MEQCHYPGISALAGKQRVWERINKSFENCDLFECRGLTDESEILKFLQHGTLVGLLPVPHPILIRKYQANSGTAMWFRTYMWGVIYLRNVDPPIWYDTDVKLFEIQRV
ncbi:hypothetical protein scyTo_0025151 [Scyliorhinus torazame]|uniref:Uncharacterized protein n=1 Tax=Scyliorhinus torazame TaxID=75743 RepID=A0A401QGA6_SCYTO|nr:hypothetical protein [Scyliorhinus torazame]